MVIILNASKGCKLPFGEENLGSQLKYYTPKCLLNSLQMYMDYFSSFITIIVIVKICFIVLAIYHRYLKHAGKSGTDLDNKVKYWSEKLEKIFMLLMALLMIFLFNPNNDRMNLITKPVKYLFFIFGIILVVMTDWDVITK